MRRQGLGLHRLSACDGDVEGDVLAAGAVGIDQDPGGDNESDENGTKDKDAIPTQLKFSFFI
jgi:hypothetical protein